MKTSLLVDHEPMADRGTLVRALLRIEGDPPADEDRVPLNLSLVLDRSGSMSGEPLRAARDAAASLVRRLRTEDTVSVVAYDDRVEVVAPPATGDAQNHLTDRIAQIRARGTTNLSGGWLRGRDLVAENVREGGLNRVLLLTDGQANVGITEPAGLIGLCRSAVESGISTTTIGFGPGYDEDLLAAMADAGRGGAYYVEKADQAAGVFEEELEGLLSLAAQNVRVTVEPGADAGSVDVAHHYPSHAQGNVLTVEVGDLYAREPRRVLMQFRLAPIASGAEADVVGDAEGAGESDVAEVAAAADVAEVAEVGVTAHVLMDDGGVELQTITLPIRLSPEEGGRVEPEVRREMLLLAAARAREEALEAERRGAYDEGGDVLREAIGTLAREAGADDAELTEELEDLRLMEQRFESGVFSMQDVKYMKQRVYDASRSRHLAKERTRRKDGG